MIDWVVREHSCDCIAFRLVMGCRDESHFNIHLTHRITSATETKHRHNMRHMWREDKKREYFNYCHLYRSSSSTRPINYCNYCSSNQKHRFMHLIVIERRNYAHRSALEILSTQNPLIYGKWNTIQAHTATFAHQWHNYALRLYNPAMVTWHTHTIQRNILRTYLPLFDGTRLLLYSVPQHTSGEMAVAFLCTSSRARARLKHSAVIVCGYEPIGSRSVCLWIFSFACDYRAPNVIWYTTYTWALPFPTTYESDWLGNSAAHAHLCVRLCMCSVRKTSQMIWMW